MSGKAKHQAFLTAKGGFEQIAVTATAPSKTFNLAGLQVSNLVIKNKQLRQKFQAALDASGYSQLNAAGLIACKTAYQSGGEWYEAVKKYIQSNIEFMMSYLKENIPQIKMIYPEATYLVWGRLQRSWTDGRRVRRSDCEKSKSMAGQRAHFRGCRKGISEI